MAHREWLFAVQNKGERLESITRGLKGFGASIQWGRSNLESLAETLIQHENTITEVNQSITTSEEEVSTLCSRLHWYKIMAVETEAAAHLEYEKAAQCDADHYYLEDEAMGRENHAAHLEVTIHSL